MMSPQDINDWARYLRQRRLKGIVPSSNEFASFLTGKQRANLQTLDARKRTAIAQEQMENQQNQFAQTLSFNKMRDARDYALQKKAQEQADRTATIRGVADIAKLGVDFIGTDIGKSIFNTATKSATETAAAAAKTDWFGDLWSGISKLWS